MNDLRPERVAIIDLGSNTARLIVMQSVPGYSYRLVDKIREVVRLRAGLTEHGLNEAAVSKAFSTLRLFKRFCDSTGVDSIIATTTSAVRQAQNGPDFVKRVEEEIGLQLDILDGQREAYLGVLGVLNEIPFEDGHVVDIGGGSAQISEVSKGDFVQGNALPLGALALTTDWIKKDPPDKKEIDAVQKEIDRHLDSLGWLNKKQEGQLIGVGGTIRNLARIEATRENYPLPTLHGYELTRASIEKSIQRFCELPLKKRKRIEGLNPDRADIILPGAMVLLSVLNRLGRDSLQISISGIREGAFLERFWQHLAVPVIPDVRRFSVLNLARNYGYERAHANHVRYLCERLFDQLDQLHRFGQEERALLNAAALLHDIRCIIDYQRHHKHSQTLIETNGLAGYSPREIALIALLARYHRKGTPRLGRYESILGQTDKRHLIQLSAILRLAEYLERGRNGAIDDVILTWTDSTLRFTLIADDYPHVELWQSEQHAVALMEEAFGRQVVIDSVTAPQVADVESGSS